MTADKKQCSARVYPAGGRGWHAHPCSKPATVERNGKWWCAIHDPVRVAARQKAKDADYNAKRTAEKQAREAVKQWAAARLDALLLLVTTTTPIEPARHKAIDQLLVAGDALSAARNEIDKTGVWNTMLDSIGYEALTLRHAVAEAEQVLAVLREA